MLVPASLVLLDEWGWHEEADGRYGEDKHGAHFHCDFSLC